MNSHHRSLLGLIKKKAGKPTHHTFLDNYLGTTHPRYPMSVPATRSIAKSWMNAHREMSAAELQKVLDSLIRGKSFTEKCLVGSLMDESTPEQLTFNPRCFNSWLDQLEGWAEIDSLCTGKYPATVIPANFQVWKKMLIAFSKNKNISKRRASLVLLCSPLRNSPDQRLARLALENIDRLKHEKEVLITKAISWVLRSMAPTMPDVVKRYVAKNQATLPSIAVRETLAKLKTGRKSGK